MAEDAARELPNLALEDALQLVHLYAERGSPKYEKAAMRWLERYLIEGSPRLRHFAEVAVVLARRRSRARATSPRSCGTVTSPDIGGGAVSPESTTFARGGSTLRAASARRSLSAFAPLTSIP